jgi:hypothetical protein
VRGAQSADVDHLYAWAAARRGVEGFVEPQTSTTATTLVLVAGDGEWTRRRVDSPRAAFSFGKSAGLPVYDVAAVGYPGPHAGVDGQAQGGGADRRPGGRPGLRSRSPSASAASSARRSSPRRRPGRCRSRAAVPCRARRG